MKTISKLAILPLIGQAVAQPILRYLIVVSLIASIHITLFAQEAVASDPARTLQLAVPGICKDGKPELVKDADSVAVIDPTIQYYNDWASWSPNQVRIYSTITNSVRLVQEGDSVSVVDASGYKIVLGAFRFSKCEVNGTPISIDLDFAPHVFPLETVSRGYCVGRPDLNARIGMITRKRQEIAQLTFQPEGHPAIVLQTAQVFACWGK
jgi:hypothetical protein